MRYWKGHLNIFRVLFQAGGVAQQVESRVKDNNLSLIPITHTVGAEDQLLEAALRPPQVCRGRSMPIHIHK